MNQTNRKISLSDYSNSLAYYLGNKRRMTDAIFAESIRLAPNGGVALDLFSGMGAVSAALSHSFNVLAVDVQEYARAVCSALLNRADSDWDASFFSEARERRNVLRRIYSPLIGYERTAMDDKPGADERMAELVEHGCLLPECTAARSDDFNDAIEISLMNRTSASAMELSYDSVVRYYGGTYFSYEQAVDIASLRAAADCSPDDVRDRYLACIICSASQCGSTIGGQFAQPLKVRTHDGKLKTSAIRKARVQRAKSIFKISKGSLAEISELSQDGLPGHAIKSECTSFLQQLKEDVALVYADPPYSRYHYSRYYHVLETIALADEPSLSLNPATRKPAIGIYRSDRYQSPYSTRTGAITAFESLFEAVEKHSRNFILSYSPYPEKKRATPRMVTIDILDDLAHRFFKRVDIKPVSGVKHSKLTRASAFLDSSAISEVLIICRN